MTFDLCNSNLYRKLLICHLCLILIISNFSGSVTQLVSFAFVQERLVRSRNFDKGSFFLTSIPSVASSFVIVACTNPVENCLTKLQYQVQALKLYHYLSLYCTRIINYNIFSRNAEVRMTTAIPSEKFTRKKAFASSTADRSSRFCESSLTTSSPFASGTS